MEKIKWKSDERMRHILQSLMNSGFDAEEISKIMDTTVASIKGAAATFTTGFRAARHANGFCHDKEWTHERIEVLKNGISNGMTFDELANLMKCNKPSLRNAINRHTKGLWTERYLAGKPMTISKP